VFGRILIQQKMLNGMMSHKQILTKYTI